MLPTWTREPVRAWLAQPQAPESALAAFFRRPGLAQAMLRAKAHRRHRRPARAWQSKAERAAAQYRRSSRAVPPGRSLDFPPRFGHRGLQLRARNGQAQARPRAHELGSACRMQARVGDSEELLKDEILVLRVNTDPGVLDGDDDLIQSAARILLNVSRKLDLSAIRRVLDGIGHDVTEGLHQSLHIRFDGRQATQAARDQCQLALFDALRQWFDSQAQDVLGSRLRK